MSKKSELRKDETKKEDWDSSTQGDKVKPSPEEMVASKLADQILETNPHLRSVHSKASMKECLKRNAMKQFTEN